MITRSHINKFFCNDDFLRMVVALLLQYDLLYCLVLGGAVERPFPLGRLVCHYIRGS